MGVKRKKYKRLLDLPLSGDHSIFLFGPRGCGKSFWLKENLKSPFVYIDLLDTEINFDLQVNPSRLKRYIGTDKDAWIVIDEVQKIPALLDEVHRLIENDRRKFILTGSSARKLRKDSSNLLAGRALTYKMYPLTAVELAEDFDIAKSLQYGHMPSIYDNNGLDTAKYLESYIKTYLKEEVQQEGLSRNISAFARFLEIASFSQASTLNISEIAREAALKTTTVSNYFDLIEDMLISYRLPVFTKRAKRRMIAHPKFFYFDSGIYFNLRPKSILDSIPEAEGASLETLIYQDLIAINDYYDLKYKIFYWRTAYGNEVDFILLGTKKLIAIEAKHSSRVHRKDTKSLKSFKEDYPEADLYLIYLGSTRQDIDGVKVIPATDFLLNLDKFLRRTEKKV